MRICNSLETTCGPRCPCREKTHNTHLNVVKKDGSGKAADVIWVNIRGRAEHEVVIKDAEWCKELGLDQKREVKAYLDRWGNWLAQ